jgi:hypothetical protein
MALGLVHAAMAASEAFANIWQIDGVEHMVVDIDDLESEDILTHLPRCMDFIYDHSKDGGNVLVHWYVF